MHELGLLTPIVRAAEEAYRDAGASAVTVVALRFGSRSGTTRLALEGGWALAVAGSVIEGADLVLEEVAAAVWCPHCDAEREIDELYAGRCPVCERPTAELVRGRELEVAYVDLEVPEHT